MNVQEHFRLALLLEGRVAVEQTWLSRVRRDVQLQETAEVAEE